MEDMRKKSSEYKGKKSERYTHFSTMIVGSKDLMK